MSQWVKHLKIKTSQKFVFLREPNNLRDQNTTVTLLQLANMCRVYSTSRKLKVA